MSFQQATYSAQNPFSFSLSISFSLGLYFMVSNLIPDWSLQSELLIILLMLAHSDLTRDQSRVSRSIRKKISQITQNKFQLARSRVRNRRWSSETHKNQQLVHEFSLPIRVTKSDKEESWLRSAFPSLLFSFRAEPSRGNDARENIKWFKKKKSSNENLVYLLIIRWK